jgi:uncharacterized protein
MPIEQRFLNVRAELRAKSDFTLEGYAATYNTLSHDLGSCREKIAPGAFDRSLRDKDDVRCLFNHSSNKVLGRVSNGTLQLSSDNRGLKFRCQLDKNQQWHRDLFSSVQRGDIGDCSFAFICPDGGDDFNQRGLLEDGKTPCTVRTLRNVKLLDVSCVTTPAYPQTAVDARQQVHDASVTPAAIAAFEKRQRERRQQSISRAQKLLKDYSPLDADTIKRGIKLGYSEDTFLQLRSAAIGKEIRQGCAFEAEPMRYQEGQAADPQQSVRTDFDFDDDDSWDDDEHDRCAALHRALSASSNPLLTIKHLAAAKLHDQARAAYPDRDTSRAARCASKELL